MTPFPPDCVMAYAWPMAWGCDFKEGCIRCKCKCKCSLLAISESEFDNNSGEPGAQAKGVNHLETPLRQLHATHRASSCAKRGGHVCGSSDGGNGVQVSVFSLGCLVAAVHGWFVSFMAMPGL